MNSQPVRLSAPEYCLPSGVRTKVQLMDPSELGHLWEIPIQLYKAMAERVQ